MAATGTAAIAAAAEAMVTAFGAGHKVLVFGNGGSAADAQHFVAELVVRYERERPPRAAIALTTDTSVLTAMANDIDFSQVFVRQLEALGKPGDVAFAITTSGRSPNVVKALERANALELKTIVVTGGDGGDAGRLAQIHVNVPSPRTATAQEVHITVLHILCELIDNALTTED